jgi:hypothetical protein
MGDENGAEEAGSFEGTGGKEAFCGCGKDEGVGDAFDEDDAGAEQQGAAGGVEVAVELADVLGVEVHLGDAGCGGFVFGPLPCRLVPACGQVDVAGGACLGRLMLFGG